MTAIVILKFISDKIETRAPDAEKIIADFRLKSLTEYQKLANSWLSSPALDIDQQFDIDGEVRAVQNKDVRKVEAYASCPKIGAMTLLHRFETVSFVPIGHTPFEIREKLGKGGFGDPIKGSFDANGLATVQGCTPEKEYQITFYPNVGVKEIRALYASYSDILETLSRWLTEEWNSSIAPLWRDMPPAVGIEPLWQVTEAFFNGVSKAWQQLLDDIKSVYALLKNLDEYVGKITDYISKADFDKLMADAKTGLHNALMLLSDEPLICLYAIAVLTWVKLQPPTVIAELAGGMLLEIFISVVIGIVVTKGAGLAVRVGAKAAGAARAGTTAQRLTKAMQALVELDTGIAAHISKLKPVAVRGTAPLNSSMKGPLVIRSPAQNIHIDSPNTSSVVRKPDSKLTATTEHRQPDASKQAKNPDDKPAEASSATRTHGCPVSMVTGEELLTLTDTLLDGRLPFEWTRLYRTSAVEHECGLGPGWSHALAQRVTIENDAVIWLDHENRRTEFPLPSVTRPAFTNNLSKAAIYQGEGANELILTQAGEQPRFYHFQHDGRAAALMAISDRYDNRLHVQRDVLGRIARLHNGAGRALQLRYDRTVIVAIDYQTRVLDAPNQNTWHTEQTVATYRYDSLNRLIEASNATGESEHYRYDNEHVIQSRQLAGGAQFFWDWEGAGKSARCVRHWANFAQMDTTYSWGDDGSVTVCNADGSEEVYVHDANARLVKQVDPDGATHEKAYDEQGRLIAEKDPLGAITEYQYHNGQLCAVMPAEDAPVLYEYDHHGYLSAVKRGKASWKYRRNAQGDITAQTDPSGARTDYRYDNHGRLLEIHHPDGSQHRLGWNKLGQLIDEHLPDGRQRRYRYDALGRQITRQDETGALTHYQWTPTGRLAQITLPGGGTRAYRYNAYGKVTEERDELGRLTRYEYAEHLHLVSRRINPDGSQLSYRYDNARLLLTQIDNERGERYTLDYHPNGLISQETGFDGKRTAYVYDLNGQLIEKTEFGEDDTPLKTEYQRDSAGRLLVKTLPDGNAVHYHYDNLGRLISVDDGHWPLAYEYDLNDRLITEHQGRATLRYRYDALGQLSHARLPDGNRLDYHYLPGGDLDSIDLNGQPLTRHQFQAGRELARQQGQLVSQYQYDEQGRLTQHRVTQRQNKKWLLTRGYGYDANGNLTSIDDSRKGMREYRYDPLDRLVAVRGDIGESFQHDPAGNLLAQTAQLDPKLVNVQGNRLLMQGDAHFDYDVFGNLVRERRGTGQKLVTEYRYDCQHRLSEVLLSNGQVAKYRYDAFGRRIEKDVAGAVTEFFWQGERLIGDWAPGRSRSYVYEPMSFRPLVMVDGDGAENAHPYYYQLDHLGTPQELTSAQGRICWSVRYKAYGNVARLDIEEVDNPLRFQGQYFDAETGLHYNRHRYYNPSTGRYLTADPVKLAGGLNSYRYVPNPTRWVDPLGLSCMPGDCPDSNTGSQEVTRDATPEVPANSAMARDGLRKDLAAQSGIPRRLDEVWGSSANDLTQAYRMDGYTSVRKPEIPGTSGRAQAYTVLEHPTIKEFQVHPGGGTHGAPYYKFTYNDGLEIRIINPASGFKPGTITKNQQYFDPTGNRLRYEAGQWKSWE
ncbi:RHS repeat-associated core domain-containing protein [Pseudomonas sp. URMO17WK12:I11]|uniref:RHS repeat-associated core domain-containing protein n=1 Tax=Pseudomonas sp. URMO17WK12:I11 TaxID=1283291 RepID=UPI0018D8EB55|nr:RHS repeat-associated core domain-containing protein [Pseudomonas sp. URMO17WK12:I11]MBH3361508.1 RHS repeat protein [Pseudomonas sp. URMO17WK12:I11]